MDIDYKKIIEQCVKHKELAIVVSKDYAIHVQEVYKEIEKQVKDIEIYILSGDSILCPHKVKKFDFYVVIGVECPIHPFENAVYIKFPLEEKEVEQILTYNGNVIVDSTIQMDTKNKDSCSKYLIVSKNMLFMKYFSTREDCEFYYEYTGESKMDFLMTRINKAEKTRHKKIFAVIFTSDVFEEIAIKVKNQIVNSGRYAYLLHLKNVHYNRLITIEGVDALVLIDCPVFDNLNIDIFIPIVTPCEINYILNGQWESKYDSNKIDEVKISTCTDLTQVKGAGELILQSGFKGIEYGSNDKDYTIYEGQKGTADSYDNERINNPNHNQI